MRAVSLLSIAAPLAHSSGEFFKFSSFAVDKLYKEGVVNSTARERRSLRFETCLLQAGWMTATLSRTVFDSASVPWRLTSVTCDTETHVDPVPVPVSADFSCPNMSGELFSAGRSLDMVSAETVRTCYGLHEWSLERNFDLLSSIVQAEQISVLIPQSRASILAFALVQARKPEPGQVVCESGGSCVVSRGGESVTISRGRKGTVIAERFTCLWGKPFERLPLYPSVSLFDATVNRVSAALDGSESLQVAAALDATLRGLAAALDAASLCAAVLDFSQSAEPHQKLLPSGAVNEECVIYSRPIAITVHRRDENGQEQWPGHGPWAVTNVSCGNRPIEFKARLARDAKKAGIIGRLEQHMNAQWSVHSAGDAAFEGFNRENFFNESQIPGPCHFLRLDQGSGLSFNQLCR